MRWEYPLLGASVLQTALPSFPAFYSPSSLRIAVEADGCNKVHNPTAVPEGTSYILSRLGRLVYYMSTTMTAEAKDLWDLDQDKEGRDKKWNKRAQNRTLLKCLPR